MAHITDLPPEIKASYDTYNSCPPPALGDIENFDKWTRAYTIFGGQEPSSEDMEYLLGVSEKLKAAGIKFRYGANERDGLSTAVFQNLKGMKETFKPFKAYGNIDDATVKMLKPTYDGFATVGDAYNEYCKVGQVKARSTAERDEAEIDALEGLSPHDKAIKKAQLRVERQKNQGKTGTLDTVVPAIRGFMAKDMHCILGEDCLSPVKVIIIRTEDGFDNMDDMLKAEEKAAAANPNAKRSATRFYGWVLVAAKKYGIPLVNIGTKEGKDKLDKLLPELIKQG